MGFARIKERTSAKKLLSMYRSLWKTEELFRINKHTSKMKPICHRLSRRIRAHILMCFLAYTVLRHTQIVLKRAGLSLSPEQLIDILKEVEFFLIWDKLKKSSFSYCIPRVLSKEAQQIYTLFGRDYP